MRIYIDLETTGFNIIKDEIIEIYLIKEDGTNNIVSSLHLYFNPKIALPPIITTITKITNQMLLDQKTFGELANQIVNFIGDNLLIGHNINKFDLPFLNQKLKQNGFNILTNKTYDTMIMARKKDGVNNFQKGYKLIDLATKYKIKINLSKFHGAKYDTEVTRKIFHVLNNYKRGIEDES